MKNFQDYLRVLTRRVERLQEEYTVNAPTLIIKTEISLIQEICNDLIKILK